MTTARELKRGVYVIRGGFSDTATGRTLHTMAIALDRALSEKNLDRATEICREAERLTSDHQWRAVRRTIEVLR